MGQRGLVITIMTTPTIIVTKGIIFCGSFTISQKDPIIIDKPKTMNSEMKLYLITGDIESKGFLLSVGSIIYQKMKPTNKQVEKIMIRSGV